MKEFVLISFLCFEENSEFQNRTLKRSILLRANLHDRRTFRTKGKGAWRCVIVIIKNTGLAIHCFSFIVKFSFVINKRQVAICKLFGHVTKFSSWDWSNFQSHDQKVCKTSRIANASSNCQQQKETKAFQTGVFYNDYDISEGKFLVLYFLGKT